MIANSLSRSNPLPLERQFDPPFFEQILFLLPTLSTDLCASCRNARLQVYLSQFPVMSANRCAFPHVGFSGGVVCLSPYPAAFSGPRKDTSDFAPGSAAGPFARILCACCRPLGSDATAFNESGLKTECETSSVLGVQRDRLTLSFPYRGPGGFPSVFI